MVGSVWATVFQWEFGVVSERMGRATREGGLYAKRQKFLPSFLSHHTAIEHSVLHRKWTVSALAILTTTACSRSLDPHFTDEVTDGEP